MRIDWLEVRDFRSYEQLRLEPADGVNVFVGTNASGKSNLLEALAYLGTLRSFRGAGEEALIHREAEAAVVRGEVRHRGASSLIEIEVPRSGRRRVQVNRQRLARTADLLGHVRVIVFLPDDLDVIKRGPAYRRDLLDSVAVQLWPGAYLDQQEYERALRQRNALLRQGGPQVDEITLEVWDERLSQAGAKVMDRRARTVHALRPFLTPAYSRLAGEEVGVAFEYRSGWGGSLAIDGELPARAALLREALRASRRADMERRVTTAGTHRDDPVLALDDRDSRHYASQGEQRSLILSVRLASHQAVDEATGEPPLLVLDDVFSELDMDRARALGEALPPAQTFITTARLEEVPVAGRRWTVEPGSVS